MSTPRIQAAVNELAAALIEHVQGGGAGVPSSAPAPSAAADQCPVHHTPWKTQRADGSWYKRAFCSQKTADGSYCEEKGPWLQSR